MPIGSWRRNRRQQLLLRDAQAIATREHPMIEAGNSVGSSTAGLVQGSVGAFIDVFAGCGGLSLGLMQAGWRGVLAVEKDAYAFETLKGNLLGKGDHQTYEWPDWLPSEPCEISTFTETYKEQLLALRGTVDLVAGGPPCQGFSFAGRRDSTDPRNDMFQYYVDLIKLVRPSFLLLENVRGISIGFGKEEAAREKRSGRQPIPFADGVRKLLEDAGYRVYPGLIRAVDHGVPQYRPRWIVFAIHQDLITDCATIDPFDMLQRKRTEFLLGKGLPTDRPITVKDAISDLERGSRGLVDCRDSDGFKEVRYGGPITDYQRLLHGNMDGTAPNSMRLANHRVQTRDRFATILETCRRGVLLSPADRERLKLKKQCTVPLDGDKPSHTLTTLPDDFLHYAEPRILTVREYARLQSFPDWFAFKGKYTTGSDQRVRECPRYTQVGNAVPPHLAEALGQVLGDLKRMLALEEQSAVARDDPAVAR